MLQRTNWGELLEDGIPVVEDSQAPADQSNH
jgi:hypothetical protein